MIVIWLMLVGTTIIVALFAAWVIARWMFDVLQTLHAIAFHVAALCYGLGDDDDPDPGEEADGEGVVRFPKRAA